jgi:HEAT repeat protein
MLFGLGTPNVQKMSERLDIEGLIKALGYEKDCDVRWHAAKALGEIGDSRAAGPLTKALDDTCVDVRASAKEALQKMEISRGCGIE